MATEPIVSPRVILVEYYVAEDRTLIFGVSAEASEPHLETTTLTRKQVRELTGRVSRALREDHLGLTVLLEDERLAELVAPLARWTRPGDVVYIVPHDVLHVLPLHAVLVEGQPLIDRNPVAVTPSASVLRYTKARRRRGTSALIVADPPAERPLIFAREQAHMIAAGFDRPEVLAGTAASRAALLAMLAAGGMTPDVVHFAAHGVFDPDEPMRSGIELADGRLTAEDILGLSLDVDLVTLGACDTGVSDRRPGDELLGLTRALLYAGARSALVTLWRVDELSTSMLLQSFYRELADGMSKAESLRRAQRWLRACTVADALKYARDARERLRGDPEAEATLSQEEARLLMRAGDRASAQRLLETALQIPEMSDRARSELRVARLQVLIAALDDAAAADQPAFDNPYHWAPFILVGDWK